MFRLNFDNSFLNDVLLTLAVIKQAKFLICDSSVCKFLNDLDDQNLILATRDSTYSYYLKSVTSIIEVYTSVVRS
jgi:hypothetical protein